MSKLAQALGNKYQENRISVLTKTFVLGEHTFKVRVPSVSEIEAIYEYFKNPNEDDVEKEFQNIIKDLPDADKYKEGNDVVIEGRSMRESAKNKCVIQHRIVEYIKLLIPENGESLQDLTYQDVEEEFPLSIQLELVNAINNAISPNYEGTRGK